MLGEAVAAKDAQRVVPAFALIVVPNHVVRPGHERGDVAGHHRCGCELPPCGGVADRCCCWRDRVGNDLPMIRCGDGERERCFQIGLFEAGIHPAGICGLELGVEVHLVVDWIDKPMQPFAGVHVGAVRDDPNRVGFGQPGQLNAMAIEVRHRDLLVVQRHFDQVGRDQIEPGAISRCGKPHDRRTAECLVAGSQVEFDLVGLDHNLPGPFRRFSPGDVGCIHLCLPLGIVPRSAAEGWRGHRERESYR